MGNVFENADKSVPVYAYDEQGNRALLGKAVIDAEGDGHIEFVGDAGKAFVDFASEGTLHELSINAVTQTEDKD